MIPEVPLQISHLLPVTHVQSCASNGEDWVRILEIWSPNETVRIFTASRSLRWKSRVVINFFVAFLMLIFLTNEFQFSLTGLLSVNFCEVSSKILPILLCTNILCNSSFLCNILSNILFQYTNEFSNKSLPRHPAVYLLARRRENKKKQARKMIFSFNMYLYEIYMYIKFYVTFSYETGLQVKFKINKPWKNAQVHYNSGLRE